MATEKSAAERSSRGEITPAGKQTNPVNRLNNTLKPPKRGPLGNPWKSGK